MIFGWVCGTAKSGWFNWAIKKPNRIAYEDRFIATHARGFMSGIQEAGRCRRGAGRTFRSAHGLEFCCAAAQARRRYSSNAHSPLLPVWRVTTRSRLGTKAMYWPPEPGLAGPEAPF